MRGVRFALSGPSDDCIATPGDETAGSILGKSAVGAMHARDE